MWYITMYKALYLATKTVNSTNNATITVQVQGTRLVAYTVSATL